MYLYCGNEPLGNTDDGNGRGSAHGTRVHTEFSKQVQQVSNGRLHSEVAYKNGVRVNWNTPGSVRVDVVRGNPNKPKEIYDLKTGNARLTPKRVEQIRKHFAERVPEYPYSRGATTMKTRELLRYVRQHVMPSLQGFRVHRSLTYKHPVEMILRGFDWQPSYLDPCAFTVEVFAQPLYVPSDCVVYTFGSRLSWLKHRRDIWWRLDCDNESNREIVFRDILASIFDVGLPFLERLSTPEKFVQHGARASGVSRDPHVQEAIAYSRVLIGDYSKATKELKRLYDELVREQDEYPWMNEMVERIAHLLKLLTQSPDAALHQLHAWRDWTLKQLRLEKEIEPH